jgi:hypothetical protein
MAAPRASPEGSRPSVSVVNEITTGRPAVRAARLTPMASSVYVMVTAVTMSASVSAKMPI